MARFAPLVREHLWRGSLPPPGSPIGWDIRRDLSIIWQLLRDGYDADRLEGAITASRQVFPDRGITMSLLYQAGNRQRLALCEAAWMNGKY